MATVYVAAKLDAEVNKFERHKLSPIDLQIKVKSLRDEIGKKLNKSSSDIELIFLGKCLKLEESLEEIGIQPGMTVFALPKQQIKTGQSTAEPTNQADIQQLVVALRSALVNPAFRNMLELLKKPEVMENIIAATPGLSEDPISQAILQDPELLMLLVNPTHIQRVVELHPSLAAAATPVAAAFYEEIDSTFNSASTSNTSGGGGGGGSSEAPPTAISYSLDALSDDDDEMDTREQELMAAVNSAAAGLGNVGSPAPITPGQLASALASVANGAATPRVTRLAPSGSPSQVGPSSPGQLQTPPSTPRSLITSEMFSHAVQQALGVVNQPNLQSQLQQLRDMGISDDAVSMRALIMTEGNVLAALELIFGGFSNLAENV